MNPEEYVVSLIPGIADCKLVSLNDICRQLLDLSGWQLNYKFRTYSLLTFYSYHSTVCFYNVVAYG